MNLHPSTKHGPQTQKTPQSGTNNIQITSYHLRVHTTQKNCYEKLL